MTPDRQPDRENQAAQAAAGPAAGLRASVIVASYRRPAHLADCLAALARQTQPAGEVIVVWQGQDEGTRAAAGRMGPMFGGRLKAVHSPAVGIVPAENAGLAAAGGDVFLFIDDDAVAFDGWIAGHLRHYCDPAVGAVGGPALNHTPERVRFPVTEVGRLGELTWYGKFIGNLNDCIPKGRRERVLEVEVLAGGNMSFRRGAIGGFDENLRDYWQLFEIEACQQALERGYKAVFDLDNPVLHYPASKNKVYDGTRDGDLTQKFFNSAYNHAYILSKYTRGLLRGVRLAYLMAVSSVPFAGPAKFPIAVLRYGNPRREFRIMRGVFAAHWRGWRAGQRVRAGR